jgi:hypothetical protein
MGREIEKEVVMRRILFALLSLLFGNIEAHAQSGVVFQGVGVVTSAIEGAPGNCFDHGVGNEYRVVFRPREDGINFPNVSSNLKDRLSFVGTRGAFAIRSATDNTDLLGIGPTIYESNGVTGGGFFLGASGTGTFENATRVANNGILNTATTFVMYDITIDDFFVFDNTNAFSCKIKLRVHLQKRP